MYNFVCKVITPQGQITKIKMQEKDKISCLKKLKRNGMTPVSVEKKFSLKRDYDKNIKKQKKLTSLIHSSKKKNINLNFNTKIQFFNKVDIRELKKFTEEFYLLKNLNFNNTKAISVLIENTENTYFKQILNKILKELKSGKRIYKTMNQYTNIFPPVYINFIKTGELTGNLKEYLKHAITYLEDEEKIKSKITENLIPSITVFIGIMLLTIISVFIVIPGFQEILEASGKINKLPKITLIVSEIVRKIIKYWYLLITLIFVVISVFINYINTEKGKYKLDYFKYNNLIFGKLKFLLDFSRIINSLFINLKSKMRIQDALEITKTVTNNTYMLGKIEEAISNIYTGKSWISAFENEKNLSPVIIEIIRKANSKKSLDMLENALEFINNEIKDETEKLLTRLPEISYIIIGILILLFSIVFLIPFLQIYFSELLFI